MNIIANDKESYIKREHMVRIDDSIYIDREKEKPDEVRITFNKLKEDENGYCIAEIENKE